MPVEDDKPTLPAWALATAQELERQIDRLLSGHACRECLGAGKIVKAGKIGSYITLCYDCNGLGLK